MLIKATEKGRAGYTLQEFLGKQRGNAFFAGGGHLQERKRSEIAWETFRSGGGAGKTMDSPRFLRNKREDGWREGGVCQEGNRLFLRISEGGKGRAGEEIDYPEKAKSE